MLVALVCSLLPWTQQWFSRAGLRWLYIIWIAFALSYCLTPLARIMAYRFQALDIPDDRKVHESATPLLGGAAVFLAFLIAILVNGVFSQELVAIVISACLMFIVGLLDDIRGLSATFRLLIQLTSVGIIIYFGVVLRVFPREYGLVSSFANIFLTVIWVLGITNAFNFFDGMDGMASGLGVIIAFFLGVVAFQTDQPFFGWIAAAIMGSCLGFLPYNMLRRGRAIIFLGDAGSTVIGYLLACLAVYGDWNPGNHVVAIAAPLLIFWILIFDMVHITVDRIVSGKVHSVKEWIDYVGQDHLHHRIADAVGGKKRSVFFIFFLSICFGCSAVVLRNADTFDALVLLAQALFLVVLVTVLERRSRTSKSEECAD